MAYSITKNGVPLDKSLYTIDEETKKFSSNENELVLDFSDCHCWTFNTGRECKFDTGYNCKFDTGDSCTFDTGARCKFDTGDSCKFYTGCDCTFDTGYNCKFDTGDSCTFKTGASCKFDTGKYCVTVRRDIYEVIELKEDVKIKLNGYGEAGYVILKDE